MIWAIKQLAVPCNYLRIRHGDRLLESKVVYDFVLPIALTGITAALCWGLGAPLSVFSQADLFDSISSLLAILVGFYMAALAAVSTFERKGIDEPLKGGDATLRLKHRDTGEVVIKKLSYRQFISYLFGYASFLSFLIYLALLLIDKGWERLGTIAHQYRYWSNAFDWLIEPAAFFVVFFAIWQLFVTSLLGIYFLAERLQSLNDADH